MARPPSAQRSMVSANWKRPVRSTACWRCAIGGLALQASTGRASCAAAVAEDLDYGRSVYSNGVMTLTIHSCGESGSRRSSETDEA